MGRLNHNEREFVAGTQPREDETLAPPKAGAALQEIDARGLSSPMPILRAHRALRAMTAGQVLKVVTSQVESLAEFQALAKYVTNYELLSQQEQPDEYVHLLRRRR
jgi:tRNA 2-thiouridine synthesizing protein A